MQDSVLDRLLAPKPQGDPLDELLREQAERQAAAALVSSSGDPERIAKANRLARETGLPLSTAERRFSTVQREVSIRRALQDVRSSTYLADWFADPVRATVGRDDTAALKSLSDHFKSVWGAGDDRITASVRRNMASDIASAERADGFISRSAALLRSGTSRLVAGVDRAAAALNQWSADNPLPWTSAESIAGDRERARQLTMTARAREQAVSTAIRGQTTWEQVKARPTPGRVVAYGAEQTVQSLPGMAAAALALPAYVVSQSGNIGQQRAQNDRRRDASLGDVVVASPAAVASALLERVGIRGIFGSTGANLAVRVGKAAGREAVTEALQSDIEYAGGSVGTEKGFDPGEALDQMAAGAVGGAFGGGSIRGVQEAGGAVRTVLKGAVDRRQAANEAAFLDAITESAAATKLKERDPQMLQEFLEGLTEDTPVENVFIPADAIRQLYQDGYRDDPFFGDYAAQIDEAIAYDGDVVLPTAAVAARLAGTPAWDTLKGAARFSPGGISRSEAEAFNGEVADLMTAAVEQAAERLRSDAQAAEPRQKLYGSILQKLTDAQFTPDTARQYAELLTARMSTRAARLGQELTGRELDDLSISRVLPEALRPIVATNELDLVIGAMRRGRDAQVSTGGPTLLEWIAARGGIEDAGGDIASMGGATWHRGKPGKRKLIRPAAPRGQGSLITGEASRFGLDDTLQDAIDAGFFPELQRSGDVVGGADSTTYADKPDARALLEAIDAELRGTPRRAASPENDRVRELADQLVELLDQGGIDSTTASDADIRKFVQRFQAETAQGRGYEQDLIDGARPERSARTFREARAAAADFQGEPLTNVETGIVARVSRNSLDKMLSGKAAAKSTSGADHALAVANADKLFTNALLDESRPDRAGDPSIEAIQRFVAPMINGKGAVLAVKMTVKAIRTAPNTLYTIETIEIDEAGEARIGAIQPSPVQASAPVQEPVVAPPGFSPKVASMLAAVKSAARRSLDQSFESGARGRITFQNERRVIELFAKADLSTLIHEAAGHDWLEQLQADAARAVEGDGNEASRQLFADWETVKAWFAANGHAVAEDGTIPVEAHEMWARGVERYVMEGKSPTPALRRVFEAFRSWLLAIYQVVDNLRSPITPEIREVMDRLIATDEELALAREEQGLTSLFDTAQQAGMTDAEFAAYRQAAEEARSDAFDALLWKTMRAVRAARTAEFRSVEGGVRREVTESVDGRPLFRAMAMLRDRANGVRLDRQWLIDTYGADALDLIPKAVPPLYGENGTPADDIASLTGFTGGDEMVRSLMGLEARRKEMRAAGDKRAVRQSVIDEEVRAIMFDRYGDPLGDGSIEREAREIIHNDRQGDVIAAELRALQRLRRAPSDPNQAATPYAIAKRWAARKVAEGTVADVSSRGAIQSYLRSARRAAADAERAMLDDDIDGAFRHKQTQMLNNALAAEAKRAADEVEAAVARLSKVAKRRTMKSVDQDYLEQAHSMLEQVELKDRSQRSLDRQASFESWARQREAEGFDVVVPSSFGEALGTTHWTRLSVERLLGLDAAVSQIMHLGRLKQTLIDSKNARDFDEVVREAEVAAAALPQKPPSNLLEPGRIDQIKDMVGAFDASLLKMETVFDWLDGGKSDGVFNRIAFRPIADAQDRENAMLSDYLGRIKDAFSDVPAKIARRWGERVSPGFINRETGEPFVMTRQALVAMALNMGNEGNIQRLVDGYGWPEMHVREVLNRELTVEEWQFVQKVWDIIDTLWPEIAAMERRVNGVEPDKVEAKPLETPAGTLRGGYYPAVYDTARSYKDEQFSGEASDLLEGAYTRATTRASSTKERSEKVQRPIALKLGVINRHLGEVIHDITHREAVINAWKFLGSERVMRAVDQSLGRQIRSQFKPWLRFVANRWAVERAGNEGAGAFLNGLRANTTIVGMGFRVSTIMMQIAGYSNSFEYVGARWVAPEIAHFLKQLTGKTVKAVTFQGIEMPPMMAFAMERSGELRSRMDTLDRDIRVSLAAMEGKRGTIWDVKRFMFHGIGYMDRVVSVPTWMGAYNKAVAGGATEADAAYAADKAVRMSQGASSAKDMVAIHRGTGPWGQALKFLTFFYTYMSAFHQRQRTFGRDVAQAVRERNYRVTPSLIARAWWLFLVPPVLAELLAGRGPEDDEDWGWWAFRKSLFQSLGPIPIVRDIGEPIWATATDKPTFGYSLSPLQKVGETFVNVGGDIGNVAEGEETRRATRHALEAVGYTTGLVPGQVATSVQFLVDVGYGEQDPETAAEWWQGLTKGKVKED